MTAAVANPRPVLVLDADQVSALAVVRSLGRAGIPVRVASAGPLPLAAASRHALQCLHYPDPLTDEAGFVAWLRQRQLAQPLELTFPITERTVVPLMRQRATLDDLRLAIAPTDALEQVLDKSRTLALAQRLGIAIPHSLHISTAADLAALDAAGRAWHYPVVVKPGRSVGQDNQRRVQLSVEYAHDRRGLQQLVAQQLRYGEVILQEYFPGDGVGVELIADHGRVRHAFQHRRLHEVPLTGGGSSLRCSETVVPALLQAAEQLVRALGWHGVAMVEFKYQSATGQFRLMEINGRFWGSLPLAVAAGADFPVMLYELMTTGNVTERASARPGVVCRQLARDIDWLEHVLRRAAPPGLVRFPSASQVLRDWALVFSPRHHFDVQSWRDPWPGLVDLGRILRHQGRRIQLVVAQKLRLRRELRAARTAGRRALADARAAGNRQVLFLCYGNINRSALAQAYAQGRQTPGLRFASAGFHAPAGRPADPVMVEVAAQAGVNLAQWQSHTLDAGLLQAADLILAMELAHLDRLLQAYPQARGKAFLLGAATARDGGQAEIADPYGHPRGVYQRVCQQVTTAVDAWLTPTPRH